MSVADQWAAFVCELDFDDLPQDVVERARRALLDSIGVGLVGSQNPACAIYSSYLESIEAKHESTVLASGLKTTAAHAAMANASFIHSTELWEVFIRVRLQPAIVCTAVALAVGEKTGATGRQLITAMVAGYELILRLGMAQIVDASSPTYAAKDATAAGGTDGPQGFYLTGATFGTYGAAAVAAKLLGLDQEQTRHALTSAASLTPAVGLEIATAPQQTMVKNLYQGQGAFVGVVAAELAARGLVGPADVMGHLKVLMADADPGMLTKGLGREFLISRAAGAFKQHSAGGMALPTTAAVLQLRGRMSIDPADIDHVDVFVNYQGVRRCAEADPRNAVSAKSSIPYVVSAVLTFFDQLADDPHMTTMYAPQLLDDSDRRELARRVTVLPSADFEDALEHQWPPKFQSRVEVVLRSGESVVGEVDVLAAGSSMTDADVVDKVRAVAGRVLPADKVDLLVREALSIDQAPSLALLMAATH